MGRYTKASAHRAALHRGDVAYLSHARAAQVVEPTPRAAWALYLILATLVTAIVWASIAHVDEITKADAHVVPEGREQVIASLEGGILRELYVHEGQQVDEGQDLARLDPKRFEAQQNEGQAKRLALRGMMARLTAEAYDRALQFPADVQAAESVVQGETEAYTARRRSLEQAVGANARSIDLTNRELGVAESMASKGLMSEVEVMRLRRTVNDMHLQSQERVNRFRQEASTDLVRVQTELAQVDEQMAGRADVLLRTVLKSPVHGLVKNIRSGTLGGVVAPGAPMMEIVPVTSRVLIEARVKPADIGFLRVGQTAQVKLTAYDYTTYGGLKGRIEYISPDALGDPDRPTAADATYYRAMVRADRPTLHQGSKPLPVIPGMTASIEVRTGERSVISFLLRPVLKSREAFREK